MRAEKEKKIILAVDDVSMNLFIIKGILSKYFEVRLVKSAEMALIILEKMRVDLILLDIEMPKMSGLDFIDIVQKTPGLSDVPIICVTSHADKEILAKAVKVGAKDYIVKPINVNSLKEKVFKLLDMPIPD